MNYTYEPEAAHAADTGAGNKFITETGAYTGKIVKVTTKKTSKGGDSINIAFESDKGQVSDYLTLQMNSAQGEKYFGYGVFMAVLRCAGVRNVTVTPTNQSGSEGEIKELAGKPLGCVLQATEYLKNTKDSEGRVTGQEVATRMELIGAFCPKTRRMSGEIDRNEAPAQLEKVLATLLPIRPLKKGAKAAPAANAPYGGHGPAPAARNEDFMDDVPF